ncbi:HCLS1-associated protein X-1 [Hyla sarda]|uniref:HCLS1-associated protein X-1 n=1 Tax=Hyla sarda TaxID=327740 RepID=UPI0024C2C71F|nr:HCLS1-associated protein X-1 [Hyla sarda]
MAGDINVFELFRRFFRPPGQRDPFFEGMTHDEEEEDDDDDDEDEDFFFPRQPGYGQESPSWRGRPPFQDPFGFEDFFRDFNELFADFGSMIHEVPRLPGVGTPAQAPEGSGTRSLRDFMLKYPDSHLPRDQAPPPQGSDQPRWLPNWQGDDAVPAPPGDTKQDKILDTEVSSRGLDSILRPKESAPSSSSYFRSVQVSRVMRPDGTMEERRTVQDSKGNETTTMTVTRGDQVISRGTSDPATDNKDSTLVPHRSLPDLSDSQTIISRFLQRWFSK